MISNLFKYFLPLMLFVSLIVILTCDEQLGEISGNCILEQTAGAVASEADADEWPCDTCAIEICLYDEEGVLIKCVEADEFNVDDPPDTIFIEYKEVPPGDYILAIFARNLEAGSSTGRELITWYPAASDSTGFVKDQENAEVIKISRGNLLVQLRDIRIPVR